MEITENIGMRIAIVRVNFSLNLAMTELKLMEGRKLRVWGKENIVR